MLPYISLLVLLFLDFRILYVYHLGECSFSSMMIWQVLCVIVLFLIILFWKRLASIKSN